VRVERVAGQADPAYDVGVRFVEARKPARGAARAAARASR